MGQQQLLLLVLGIVIVGMAVVAGLQAFAVNQKQANSDALILKATGIATDLQIWLRTPESFGGGLPATGGILDLDAISIDLETLGYPVNGADEYETIDGTFTMNQSGDEIFIEGISAATSGGGDNNIVCLKVDGAQLEDITVVVNSTIGACG